MGAQVTFVYDFFRGATGVKLIVAARRSVVVTAVVGARVFRAQFFDDVDSDGDHIRIGNSEFSADGILCDLRIQGCKINADAVVSSRTAFKRPLGFWCSLGIAEYNLSAPTVEGSIFMGSVTIGDYVFCGGDRIVVSLVSGSADRRHTVFSGADLTSGLYLACGENATFGKPWRYAVACIAHSGHAHVLSGVTKLTEFYDGADVFRIVINAPDVRLAVAVRPDCECADAGIRYGVACPTDVELTVASRTDTFRLTCNFFNLGAVRDSETEPTKSAGQARC